MAEREPAADRIQPLGAPNDPVRPTGRAQPAPTAEEAAAARRAVRRSSRVLLVVVLGLVALFLFVAFAVPWLFRA